jgi:two-component system sensor histidine kinase GlrK
MRQRVEELTNILSAYVDTELAVLLETARDAQRVSAWQVAALVPGTIILVLIFTFLVARPISQIDSAIHQLGKSGFSKPIRIKGPTDLERLGRQLDWLRLRLLDLAQEKNKFLRHMSHELKTPLANIREGTELLLDGSVGELEEQQREVADILRMNENLLSFSAWQTKSEVLNLSDFPLRVQVISVAKAQRLALKAANIQLKLEVDDIIVNADQDKIRTVLDNLLSNAVKFTPKGGQITIRASRTPTSFILEFGDTGLRGILPGSPRTGRPGGRDRHWLVRRPGVHPGARWIGGTR